MAKKWTKRQIESAIEAWVMLGNYARASRETGIPTSTIKWFVVRYPKIVESYQVEVQRATEERAKSLADWTSEQAEAIRADLPKVRERLVEKTSGHKTPLRDIAGAHKELRESLDWLENGGAPAEKGALAAVVELLMKRPEKVEETG